MGLLKQPNEIKQTGYWAGLIYGEPGAGKSTLALSGPNPVCIDADGGMKRVQLRYRKTSLPMNTYQDFLDLLKTKELDDYQMIVIDTFGKLVDKVGDWVCIQDPKNRKKGGGLSQQGYGAIKNEVSRLIREVKSMNKYLLIVAHGREEKDGEVTKIRPDAVGSSGKDLIKDLDFMGYIEMNDQRRTISFSPTERFYAKNSLKLPAIIDIPDPDVVGNTFIQKFIIEQTELRSEEEAIENKKYDDLALTLKQTVSTVVDALTANAALEIINGTPVIWDSQRVAKHALADRVKSLGLVYNKDLRAFVIAPPPVVQQTQATISSTTTATIGDAPDEFERAKQAAKNAA